jgi:superfamily II DNA or RNA helicase
MNLRDYQVNCLDKSLERYRAGCNRQLAVLATGLGKTAIASSLRSHHGIGKKVLFLIHMETLAVQAAKAIQRWNPGMLVGVEMAGTYCTPMDDFVVASVPTIGRRNSDRIKRFDPSEYQCVIQDECHIGLADSFKRVYEHFGLLGPDPEGPLFLGITATPNRSDGRGLRELFDEIVFDMGIQKGIESGWLCDLVGFRVNGKAKLDGVHIKAGDFAKDELETAVNTPERNGIIVKEWAKRAWDKRTLAFTVDVQHALDLAEAFKVHGVGADAVWGEDPNRNEKIRRHKAGEIAILTNCNVLGIGYDDPRIECIISAAPTKSELRYVQQIGRGTRIADGKPHCIVIDVVDNSAKHSLVSISTLLGLPKDLDLKGEKYSTAKEKLERVAREFPTANIQDIKSLDQLKSIAENVSLFHVAYPPEISHLSELAWRKADNGYCLAVNREMVTISQDLRQEWWVRGSLNGKRVEQSSQNLPGAFNQADRIILDNGGCLPILRRTALWRDSKPSEKQVDLCRKLGIAIPRDATKGQVSAALTLKLRSRELQYQREPEYQGEF